MFPLWKSNPAAVIPNYLLKETVFSVLCSIFVCFCICICEFVFVFVCLCFISPPPRGRRACEPAGRPTLHPAPYFLQLFNPEENKGRKTKTHRLNALFVRFPHIVMKAFIHSCIPLWTWHVPQNPFMFFCSHCSSVALASSSAPYLWSRQHCLPDSAGPDWSKMSVFEKANNQ